jgi:hypothetical protein
MADFTVRADSVNVEEIMDQIRARIRDKRGIDYTEQQIREMATVKLETFLDPRGVRSDLLERFRSAQPTYSPPELPNYAFEEQTLFESHRGPLRLVRKLLQPILKLFFNPGPLIQALNIQSRLNTMGAEREARREASRHAMDQLYYEVMHNLVVEMTRTAIEVKNLKMKVESLTGRLEFNERRARALESVVVYKPLESEPAYETPAVPAPVPERIPVSVPESGSANQPASAAAPTAEGPGQRSRRRRRRRGRRGGGPASAIMEGGAQAGQQADDQTDDGIDDGPDGGEPGEMTAAAPSGAETAERPAGERTTEPPPSTEPDPDRP